MKRKGIIYLLIGILVLFILLKIIAKYHSENDQLQLFEPIMKKYFHNLFVQKNSDNQIYNFNVFFSPEININLNSILIYTEPYTKLENPVLRVVVVDGLSKDYSSGRIFYLSDPKLCDDLISYIDLVYDGNIVFLKWPFLNYQIEESLAVALSKYCIFEKPAKTDERLLVFGKKDETVPCQFYNIHTNVSIDIKIFINQSFQRNFYCHFDLKNKDESFKRIKFCQKFFAFPEYCRCDFPQPIRYSVSLLEPRLQNLLENIPILIIASKRPHYFLKCIESIIKARGVHIDKIFVDIDEEDPELLGIIELFDLKISKHLAKCSGECRINEHYRSSLKDIFKINPGITHVIIFEDDLIVSNDVLYYFASTIELYDQDTSIFCVSAWNDQAYSHSVGDLTMLYRTDFMPGLGMMLSRKIFKELIFKWPSQRKQNWDAWIRESMINKRSCIIPDVSRTFHIGKLGLHSSPEFQNYHFDRRVFIPNIDVKLNNKNLEKTEYEELLDYLARHSDTVKSSSDICKSINFNLNPTLVNASLSKKEIALRTRKVFINTELNIRDTLIRLFKCLKIWDQDIRGVYNHNIRIWFNNIHYILICCPQSSLCKYLPENHRIF